MKKKILALMSAFALFAGVTAVEKAYSAKVSNVEFEQLSLPTTAEEGQIRVSPSATVYFKDGTSKKVSLKYNVLYKTADKDSYGNSAGMMMDINKNPIKFADGTIRYSVQPDSSNYFERNGKYFHIQHFENSPGMIYYTELALNSDGSFKPVKYTNIDFAPVKGTVINCSAQKSGWDTFLSAEEDYYFAGYWFDPNSAKYTAQHVNYCDKDANGYLNGKYTAPSFAAKADWGWWCQEMVKPLLTDYLKVKPEQFQPYHYGYIVEIGADKTGNPYIKNNTKHYATGKFTPEVAVVMPDNRTVYMLDDGSYTGMFMFIADKPKDMTSGFLYLAKLTQKSKDDTDGGEFSVDWVPLGHADEDTLKEYVDRGISLSDMFDVGDPANCGAGYTKMNGYETGKAGMCVRLKDGTNGSKISSKFNNTTEVHQAAGFLEPRKYGVLYGGTMEFSKGEGVTYDHDQDAIYFAISRIEGSMKKGEVTKSGSDHIRLKENKCGGVFKGTFGTAVDTAGNNLFSCYIVRNLKAELLGVKASTTDPGADKNYCQIDKIACPDNILYMGANQLFIAEDCGYHYTNALWTYNTVSKKLTRIGTVQPGAEVTGAFGTVDINGNAYVSFNAQHPYGESRSNAEGKTILSGAFDDSKGTVTDDKYKGIVGYITGLPSLR